MTADIASAAGESSAGGRKLFHLLPQHTVFHVKLTIHQLESVPQIRGQFLVKWKFKNVQSVGPGNGTIFPWRSKGKGKESQAADGIHHTLMLPQSKSHEDLTMATTGVKYDNLATPNAAGALTPSTPVDYVAEQKGYTLTRDLSNYSVTWEETIHAAVQLNVKRENNMLVSNELRLVVRQEIDNPRSGEEEHMQFGFKELDLAEYVDEGPITRRYLLQNGKTNATLKVTLDVTHLSGEKNYVKPPLPRDVVLAGVQGLMSRPPNRRLTTNNQAPSVNATPGRQPITRSPSGSSSISDAAYPTSPISRLPFSQFQSHTCSHLAMSKQDTIDIIEAIFNPFQSRVALPVPEPTPPPSRTNSGAKPLHTPKSGATYPLTATSVSFSISKPGSSSPSDDTHSQHHRRTSIDRDSLASGSGSRSSTASIKDEDDSRSRWWKRKGSTGANSRTNTPPLSGGRSATMDVVDEMGVNVLRQRGPKKNSGKAMQRDDMPWSTHAQSSRKNSMTVEARDPPAQASGVHRSTSAQVTSHRTPTAERLGTRERSATAVPGLNGKRPNLTVHVSPSPLS